MEFLSSVLETLSIQSLLVVVLGSLIGTVVGVLPGFGPINALVLLMPLCFSLQLPVEVTLVLLVAVYYGAMFGGSTTSILLNIPGEISSSVTCIDGYRLTQSGKAGEALSAAAWGSFFAGVIGVAVYLLLAPHFSEVAIRFGPIEKSLLTFSVCILVVSFSEAGKLNAAIGFLIGGCIGMIGLDPVTLAPRYTFSLLELQDGVDIVTLCLAAFAIPEALSLWVTNAEKDQNLSRIRRGIKISLKPPLKSVGAMLRGGGLGVFIGIIPGMGPSTASSFSYYAEKRLEKKTTPLETRLLRGVSAPEAANNAAVIGALLPTLIFALPGSATSSLLLGAIQSLGLKAGPGFVSENQDLHLVLASGLLLANFILLLLNLPFATLFARVFYFNKRYLAFVILSMSLVGWYFNNGRVLGLLILVLLSLFFIAVRKRGVPMVQMLLGFILLRQLEVLSRQAVQIYQ